MRILYILSFLLFPTILIAQDQLISTFQHDSLFLVSAKPTQGFHHDYLLFIPKGTPANSTTYLLVEPNNTGMVSDSLEVHKQAAIDLASKSSVGNNISTELKIPLLVPIFPRPESQPLMYTHALDRDIILESKESLKRLDLQLIAMVNDAKDLLKSNHISVHDKIFMNGFSASATFTNRFLFIHPKLIKAAAMGGLNGALMLPQKKLKSKPFNYPLGINDFGDIFKKHCDLATYKQIPQFIYMGKDDNNDAVQYDDAYSPTEQQNIKSTLGEHVQERWVNCQAIYKSHNILSEFKTYKDVGHWTTSNINLDVILFFLKHLKD